MYISKINNENNNRKRRILLATLIPCSVAVVALSCGLGFGLGCSNQWTTITSNNEADRYLKKHLTRHDESIYWTDEHDSAAIQYFSNTKNYGPQNLINGMVSLYEMLWVSGGWLKVKVSSSLALFKVHLNYSNETYDFSVTFKGSGKIDYELNDGKSKWKFENISLTSGEVGNGKGEIGEHMKCVDGTLTWSTSSSENFDTWTYSSDYPNVTWYASEH